MEPALEAFFCTYHRLSLPFTACHCLSPSTFFKARFPTTVQIPDFLATELVQFMEISASKLPSGPVWATKLGGRIERRRSDGHRLEEFDILRAPCQELWPLKINWGHAWQSTSLKSMAVVARARPPWHSGDKSGSKKTPLE